MISAIVPVLNEATALPALLVRLRLEAEEVIVVDGGSTDDTVEIARSAGVTVLTMGGGRGPQLNAGAGQATGDLLWFVHADSEVPPGSGAAIAHAARTHRWGCFHVRVLSSDPRLRWAGRWMTARARRTGSCTGDMGIWATRGLFVEVGGFPAWPALEDIAFSDAARARAPAGIVPLRFGTSARRWDAEGQTQVMLRMWAIRVGYRLGVPPMTLTTWYRSAPRLPRPDP